MNESRCLAFFVDIANLGMTTIALPTIKQDLGFNQGSLQWVLTSYALTVSQPIYFLKLGGQAYRSDSSAASLWLEVG